MGKTNEFQQETTGQEYAPAQKLKAPFPYNGGKSAVAALIWLYFGLPKLYIEPFFGSGAVWWACPHNINGIVNDLNPFIANFWLAVAYEPEKVAHWLDWPVNETYLYARHLWLNKQVVGLQAKMEADPFYYDVKMAGFWAYVVSGSIGPACTDRKVYHQKPHLTKWGGLLGYSLEDKVAFLQALANNLRLVKVCCGDWKRVVTLCVLNENSSTAIFLDPPYSLEMRDKRLYFSESDVAKEVREWAIAHGNNKKLRIALCGYEGEHTMPDNWTVYRWQANGGMGNTGNADSRGRDNKKLETIWFSPHCLRPMERLF